MGFFFLSGYLKWTLTVKSIIPQNGEVMMEEKPPSPRETKQSHQFSIPQIHNGMYAIFISLFHDSFLQTHLQHLEGCISGGICHFRRDFLKLTLYFKMLLKIHLLFFITVCVFCIYICVPFVPLVQIK